MKPIIGGLAVVLAIVSARPAASQQPTVGGAERTRAEVEQIVERSGVRPALEAVAAAATPELERSLEQLAGTLSALATRIAGDPELRLSAARAANGLADVAHVVITEQAGLLREVLRAAAERLATLPPAEPTRAPR
jgi:hypothetical protein